jgi:hypothetical protein
MLIWNRAGVTSPAPWRAPNDQTADVAHGFVGKTSDEMIDFLGASKKFFDFDSDQLGNVQQRMWMQGLLPENWDPRFLGNKNDTDSYKAWQKVLQLAIQQNKTPAEILAGEGGPGRMGGGSGGRGGGSSRAPLTIRYSNPDDLRKIAEQTATEIVGFAPDKAFMDQFVKVYQGMEEGAQRKAYNVAATGGSFTEPGSAQVQAEKKLRSDYKVEASSADMVKQFDAFLQIVGGTG